MFGGALLLCAAGAQGAEAPIPHGKLELVAERQWVTPVVGFLLGCTSNLRRVGTSTGSIRAIPVSRRSNVAPATRSHPERSSGLRQGV